MNLFNSGALFKKKNPSEQNYLALTITPEKIMALIWTFENDTVVTLGYSKSKYRDIANLVHQAAVAIDSAGEQAGVDVSQAVFGLSRSWFDDNEQISQDTTRILENMSGDLELKPQAFVPLSVAIKNYLKTSQSIEPHAVLLGLFEDSCEVYLVKNNRIVASAFTKNKPTAEKIKELIAKLEARESLPAKIVTYGQTQDHPLNSEVRSADFTEIFTQDPHIDSIDEKELATAVAFAQAADILGHEPGGQITKPPKNVKETKEPDEFGFIEGDILEKESEEEDEEPKQPTLLEEPKEIEIPKQQTTQISQEDQVEKTPQSKRAGIFDQIFTLSWLEKITSIFSAKGAPKKLAILLVVLLAIFLAASLILGLTITKAQINLQVKSEPQEENFSATIIDGSQTNTDEKQIAGTRVSASASGSQKGVPTGKKIVGNSAKGDVTVFNWTGTPKKFSEGTEIISKDGFKFTFDDEIEATSASKPSASQLSPGKALAKVTAEDVGTDYNLGANKDFTFTQFDELFYSAQNDNAFTGGDEKEITVVSQSDTDKLAKSLTTELTDKAIQSLKSANPDKVINDSAISTEVTRKQFDKNVDDEATLFNLDMEVSASVITYEQSQLNDFLANIASQDAPPNLVAKPENIQILSQNSKTSKGTLYLTGRFRANLIPKFDEGDLKSKLAQKTEKQARQILTQIPQVTDISVKFSPGFLIAPKIPKNPDKITFKIETSK